MNSRRLTRHWTKVQSDQPLALSAQFLALQEKTLSLTELAHRGPVPHLQLQQQRRESAGVNPVNDNFEIDAEDDPAKTVLPETKTALLRQCATFHSRSKAAEYWTMNDLERFYELHPELNMVILNLNDEPGGLVVFLATPEGREAVVTWSTQGTIEVPPGNSGKWE